ncbi:MAG: ketosynthase [Pseudomonadota bacterium]|nr:ketosynthase [Pseudomonadota bacterium]
MAAMRVLLAIGYPLLAHWASLHDRSDIAVLALLDLSLIVLLMPLAQRRPWAWAMLALAAVALWSLRGTPHPQLMLLAPPVLFTAMLSWWFGRSLRPPRVPLIMRIVAGLEQCEPAQLKPELQRYTRRLTATWAVLLAFLAVANTVLALIAVPDGLLARLGHAPLIVVSQEAWSWFANLLNHGIVGGFFIGEYLVRHRIFPDRPYRNFVDFLRRLGALGPGFWRELFH